MNIDSRVKKLERTFNVGEYLTLETVLEQIDLEEKATLTPAESARLKRLSALPTEPGLLRTVTLLNP